MTTVATPMLADELAEVLASGPASCDMLAKLLKRRRSDVLRALREDPDRFGRSGLGRWSSWNLTVPPEGTAAVNGTAGDGLEAFAPTAHPYPTSSNGESLSRCSDPERHRAFGAHWRDEDTYWCVRCDGPNPRARLKEERLQRFVEAFRAASPERQAAYLRHLRTLVAVGEGRET